jgi:signal transduction histidine kinase
MNLFSYIIIPQKKYESVVVQQAMELCEHITEEMGADLHDDLIQKLSVFQLLIDRLERSAQNAEECEALALKMRTEFQAVTHSVRRISRQLMPVHMEGQTLGERIKTLCQNMEYTGATHIHFQQQGSERPIGAQAEQYLHRIVQELVHNAFRHSSAWHIWVTFTWGEHALVVEVEDDGTAVTRLPEFINRLQAKYNTLKMRVQTMGATINYLKGKKGLLARVEYT